MKPFTFPSVRSDQLCVVIKSPIMHVSHYSIVDVKGVVVNFSSEQITLGSHLGMNLSGTLNIGIPKVLGPHTSTDEIVLFQLRVDRDEFDPIENMKVGSLAFEYFDEKDTKYRTEPAVFQVILQ
jgi:hypothetical protein